MIPLALPTIAALTPDHYDIRILDGEIEGLPKNEKPDFLGITTLPATGKGSFDLGNNYVARGERFINVGL